MLIRPGTMKRPWITRAAGLAVLAGALTSCSLDVFDPTIVTPEDVADPSSIPVLITGLVGDFQLAMDDYVRYTGMFVDEFILSGTFPSRQQVDTRIINFDNATITAALYEPLHTSRFSADNASVGLQEFIGDPDVDQDLLNRGIAFGFYYGAYDRMLFAEAYCQSILGGANSESPNFESAPLLPDARMQDALTAFQSAEAAATAAGLSDLAAAARVGQARVNMWLQNYSQASSIAAGIDPGFGFMAEYSTNDPSQYNDVYDFTYGDQAAIRWTVGDGFAPERNFERFEFYDEWVALGLIDPSPPPSFVAFNSSIAVHLQLIYGQGLFPPNTLGQAAPIIIASGFEADIMRGEAAYRAGDMAGAAAIINGRITDPSANPHAVAFAPVAFTGDFESDIREIGRAYEAGLWMTGHRFGFIRRVLRNDGVDLFPSVQPGSDTAFPIVKQEVDNNPNLSEPCPSGPPWS